MILDGNGCASSVIDDNNHILDVESIHTARIPVLGGCSARMSSDTTDSSDIFIADTYHYACCSSDDTDVASQITEKTASDGDERASSFAISIKDIIDDELIQLITTVDALLVDRCQHLQQQRVVEHFTVTNGCYRL